MSSSETLSVLAERLEESVDLLLAAPGTEPAIDGETLRAIVSAAARVHALCSETGTAGDPLRPGVSPTEAVDLACGLLRARDLNPFDLALWFSRPA